VEQIVIFSRYRVSSNIFGRYRCISNTSRTPYPGSRISDKGVLTRSIKGELSQRTLQLSACCSFRRRERWGITATLFIACTLIIIFTVTACIAAERTVISFHSLRHGTCALIIACELIIAFAARSIVTAFRSLMSIACIHGLFVETIQVIHCQGLLIGKFTTHGTGDTPSCTICNSEVLDGHLQSWIPTFPPPSTTQLSLRWSAGLGARRCSFCRSLVTGGHLAYFLGVEMLHHQVT